MSRQSKGVAARKQFEGPCSGCEQKEHCLAFEDLNAHLYSRKVFQQEPTLSAVDNALDRVVSSFVQSLRKLESAGRFSRENLGIALSAMVDFCISGLYANTLINDKAEFASKALNCGGKNAVFPYTWMCPLCVSKGRSNAEAYLPGFHRKTERGSTRDYPDVKLLAKPGGRAIGDYSIQVVKALLRATLNASGEQARLRDGGGARGEFDLTIATETSLTFIEVKAKPMISFPLLAKLLAQETEKSVHSWGVVEMTEVDRLYLFLGAISDKLLLTKPNVENAAVWPLDDLAQAAAEEHVVEKIFKSWMTHYESYFAPTEPDALRWHRFGCGNFSMIESDGQRVEKRVANTKELPGLDRTDDIKKGAAQVLKYSRFKFDCSRRALRAVLLGNTHALSHHDDYVEPIINLKVIASGADPSKAEWIFDAMVGLTKNTFNEPSLKKLFAFERLLDLLDENFPHSS